MADTPYSFKSPEKQRKVASILIGITALLPLLPFVLGMFLPPDLFTVPINVVIVIFTLLAGIFFLAWFYLAYGNLTVLKETTKLTHKACAIVWFIPIASLWMPLQAMNELWYSATERSDLPGRIPLILWSWWICWWLSKFFDIVANAAISKQSLDYQVMLIGGFLLSVVTDVTAAVLVMKIMKRIDERQAGAFDAQLQQAR